MFLCCYPFVDYGFPDGSNQVVFVTIRPDLKPILYWNDDLNFFKWETGKKQLNKSWTAGKLIALQHHHNYKERNVDSLAVLPNANDEIMLWPSHSTPRHKPQRNENMHLHKNFYTYAHNRISHHIQKGQTRKRSIEDWINNVWHSDTMKLAMKRSEILIHTMRMNPEIMIKKARHKTATGLHCYWMSRIGQSIETESKLMLTYGSRSSGTNGSDYREAFLIWRWRNVLKLNCDGNHITLWTNKNDCIMHFKKGEL